MTKITQALGTTPTVIHARIVAGTGGGPDKTIFTSVPYLTRQGYSSICLYLRHPRDAQFEGLRARADELGLELKIVDDFGPLDWKVTERAKGVCEELQPWIWHGHEYKSNLIGLMIRPSVPMHLVSTVHGWVQHTFKTPVYYAIDRLCLRYYDRVVCVSKDLREKCIRMGVPSGRCWYVPNGIDTEVFSGRQETSDLRLHFGVPPDRLIIGAVGRLSKEKGFGNLLESMRSLIDAGQDVELWILGEGPQRSALEDKIGSLSLRGRVRLLGHQNQMVDWYAAMDLFALSSLREGFPNVLLEAMAMELPIVATAIAGVPELIRNGSNGLLVHSGEAAALTGGLMTLISNPAWRRVLGKGARETVVRDFSFAARMEKILEIYETLPLHSHHGGQK